jgi:hypothetical protein
MSQTLSGKNLVTSAIRSETHLRGRTLVLVRGVWLLLSAGLLANFLASIPAYYAQQHVICDDAAVHAVHCLEADQPSPGNLLALEQLGRSLDDFARFTLGLQIVVALVCLVMAMLLFWRKSHTWLGLSASFFLVLLGCSGTFESLAGAFATADSPLALRLLAMLIHGAELPTMSLFLLLFPTGRFTPRWSWIVSVWWTAHVVSFNLPAPYNFNYWSPAFQASDLLLLLVSPIAIQVYRYRRVYTSIERQQTKWLIFGFAGGALLALCFGSGLSLVLGLSAPDSPWQLLSVVGGALLFSSLPLGVGIAVLRYRLWGIDALINKALVYGLLTLLLATLYGGLIIGLESLGNLVMGQAFTSPVVLVISTLAIAALFQPARSRIQALIDRGFYRQKYDAARTLETFSATLQHEVDLGELCEQVLAVVQETMQPAHLTLWLCSPRQIRKEPADLARD